jgi:hypothetical protein
LELSTAPVEDEATINIMVKAAESAESKIQPNLKFIQPEIVLVRKLMKRHYEGEGFSFHEEETEVEAQEEKEVSASLYENSATFVLIKEYDDIADFEKSRYSSLTRIKNKNKVNCTECKHHINYETHPMM